MPTSEWALQRGYVSQVYPSKGEDEPPEPKTYALKVDAEFKRVIAKATDVITRRHKSSIVLKMNDNRQHAVRDILLRLGFGQTRSPLPAMVSLAARLAASTDQRTKPSLLVVTVEERGESRRICIYAFPEESSYLLRTVCDLGTQRRYRHAWRGSRHCVFLSE